MSVYAKAGPAGIVGIEVSDRPDNIDVIARAIKEATDAFRNPVMYYISPEAQRRWEEANPAADDEWSEQPQAKDGLESYRIIARAVEAALSKRHA